MQVALAAFVDLLHSPATDSGDHWEWLEKCSVVIWINDKSLFLSYFPFLYSKMLHWPGYSGHFLSWPDF